MMHEHEAGFFPNVNTGKNQGKLLIEDRRVKPFNHPKHFTLFTGVFIIKHKLIINIANKEKHDIIMSRHLPCGFDHVLSILSTVPGISCGTAPM
jgi:hypothetical protein